jgi:D-3-phosphoglycerate dehydrogenase
MARHIPQACASMKAGKWDRKSFQGVELYGKTLGLIGMGRIGGEVARRAIALGMRVRVYDPYLSQSRARALQVELAETVDALVPDADFITVHTPMTPETKGILNAARLAACKKGVRIVNCARGGLIDEAALGEALKSGQVAAAALDVYEAEPPPADWPLRDLPNLILTPHLGASTEEAQENVGIEVAEQIADYLLRGVVRNAVNLPSVDAAAMDVLRPYLALGTRLGSLLSQVGPRNAESLTVRYHGPITQHSTAPVTRAILEGFLRRAAGPEMNVINVTRYAQQFGLEYSDTKFTGESDFNDFLEIESRAGTETASVGATFFGPNARIVRFNGRPVEATAESVLLFLDHRDRPGIIGWLGTLLGRHQVNIANMALSRDERGGAALTILQLDSRPPEAALEEIARESDVRSVRVAEL